MIAFLGYVLPYGQMSLWGVLELYLLPIIIKRNFQISTKKNNYKINDKNNSNLIEKFIGILDGDGYIEIGPQKQYNKSNNAKSTIRTRIVLRLHKDDKELLNFFMTTLKIGKLDELKSKNQYRFILFKKDILNFIYLYLQYNNIEFLSYNRRKQYFLLKYIIENNITHWEDLNLEEINNLFKKIIKQLDFSDIINLPYFNNWLIGFTMAEGSFHFKSNGRGHYSIVQSGHENYHLIKAIHYFIKGSLSLHHQIKPANSKVYRVSFSSKIDLMFILNFFENNQLLGLKKLQFDNWKSDIISNYNINSSAPNVILSKVSNNKVLNNTNFNNNNESSNE